MFVTPKCGLQKSVVLALATVFDVGLDLVTVASAKTADSVGTEHLLGRTDCIQKLPRVVLRICTG